LSERPFVEADIPQVVDLYWTFMRGQRGPAPPELRSAFQELYFTNPWLDELRSAVHESKEGKIVGFLGAVVRRMSVCGRPVRALFGGNFVVHPEYRSKLAALRMLTSMTSRGQDISLTDSANDVSRQLLERIGWSTLAPLSIHWVRPLRPAQYAAYAASRLTGPAVSSALNLIAKPFCGLADHVAARLSSNPFRHSKPRMHGEDLDAETLLRCLAEFRGGYSILPEYDIQSLKWLLNYMGRMPARGDLRMVVVRNDEQKILGWFIYYARRGGVGEVVQFGGDRQYASDLLDHLFEDAWDRGVIALHGVVNTRLMPDFSAKNCFFTCRGGWTVAHSHNPELFELLKRGDALFSRLDGEWCLDPGRRLPA